MPIQFSRTGWRVAATVVAVVALLVSGIVVANLGRPAPGGPQASASEAPLATSSPVSSPAATASTGPQLTGAASSAPSQAARPSAAPVAARPVWWIILENHEYGSIVGNQQAPYFNALAARYGLATNYYATGHPSEPNYVALVAGTTLGVVSDGVYSLRAPSIFSQLASAGRPWRVYAQDDQPGCFTGTSTGGGLDGPGAPGVYVRKHNPAISLTSVADSAAQCRNIEPLRDFDPAAGAFEMIVPNLVNDMHDGSVAQGDAFLQAFVPRILASAAFRSGGTLFIMFDEGGSSAGSHGDAGGHAATLIIAADVTPGYRDRAYLDHYSLLRATQDILGLPCLANSCRSTAIGR